MTVEELARLVLDFVKADRAVAENGWDGSRIESEWEGAKAKMVYAARHALGKDEHEEVCKGGGRSGPARDSVP